MRKRFDETTTLSSNYYLSSGRRGKLVFDPATWAVKYKRVADLAGVEGQERELIERQHRPDRWKLANGVVIRDQKRCHL